MINTLFGAYLKTHRAADHIDSIRNLSAPLYPELYWLGWRDPSNLPAAINAAPSQPDPTQRIMELAYIPQRPISHFLALFIGDAVHNLRAALDHAATALVRSMGGTTDKLYFPFAGTRHLFESNEKKLIKPFASALPGADFRSFFLDVVMPFSDGNNALWLLSKIDNIDKHNFILPIVSVTSINHNDSIKIGDKTVSFNIAKGNADRIIVLYRMAIPIVHAINYKMDISVDLEFPPGPFEGRPVVDTLEKLCTLVQTTLRQFEDFAVAAGAPVGVKRSGGANGEECSSNSGRGGSAEA